ncbi:HAD family hydrolase [Roseomonas marmotae]|uniref:HAD family phosphatase n=1 Tax=Roseomonas marmotae TaxID=2768161 RepID=A0ABS3KE01_9PROT|nr:HAD family phosphatase [Roseomonas marmotae]MBO1075660.1 HAD family phosphatase [Roseomonas marmotae]QTI79520.1 HAD family phosphatase [Roseomonas marmotae]
MTRRPSAVLFDCDGVLADSEQLVNGIVAEDLTARGWPVTVEQCKGIFLGRSIPDMVPLIERQVGPLPPEWPAELSALIARRMREDAPPMPGAMAVVKALAEAGIPMACASNSGRDELEAKLEGLKLMPFFEGRVFSYQDVPNPKPAPDMYLAAAAACGADPRDCVVVEDSALGASAGVAAGCRVLGFAHETPAALLEAQGAEPFHSMEELPRLLGIAS